MENKRVLLECSFNEDEGTYQFKSPSGASATEVIFCMAALLKCFDRDEVMAKDIALDLLQKYLNDPQYEELKRKEVN